MSITRAQALLCLFLLSSLLAGTGAPWRRCRRGELAGDGVGMAPG